MILVFTDSGLGQSTQTERIRNLSAYKSGEVEACEAIQIIGNHPNAQIVRADYAKRGIRIIEATQTQEPEMVDTVKKSRKAKEA